MASFNESFLAQDFLQCRRVGFLLKKNLHRKKTRKKRDHQQMSCRSKEPPLDWKRVHRLLETGASWHNRGLIEGHHLTPRYTIVLQSLRVYLGPSIEAPLCRETPVSRTELYAWSLYIFPSGATPRVFSGQSHQLSELVIYFELFSVQVLFRVARFVAKWNALCEALCSEFLF